MNSVTTKKYIEAPPAEVFAVVTDLERVPDVVKSISKMEVLTDGPIGVGTRFRETRKMFGKQASEVMEFVAFEPPHRYELLAESHGARYRTVMTFTPSGSGTEVAMEFDATPLTLPAKFMGFLMKPMLKACAKAVDKDLGDYKAAIEQATAKT